ncbi:unnamed protein product [[Candida] boidinii]|nr:unnamed protein product [[Candida] boidinii]
MSSVNQNDMNETSIENKDKNLELSSRVNEIEVTVDSEKSVTLNEEETESEKSSNATEDETEESIIPQTIQAIGNSTTASDPNTENVPSNEQETENEKSHS